MNSGAKKYRSKHHQQGVALLVMFFILVLISTLAIYLVEDEYLSIRRIANLRDAEQGYTMAMGSEDWGISMLIQDYIDDPEVDHLKEEWANLGTGVSVEEGKLLTSISDEQGLFNVNNLLASDTKWLTAFTVLLSLLDIQDPSLVDALVDWMDADQDLKNQGAEDSYYASLDPSYFPANRVLSDISELSLIKGFTAEIVAKLVPYVTAIPITQTSKINVNTCPPLLYRVLLEAGAAMSAADAEAAVDGRGNEGYQSTQAFIDYVNTSVGVQGIEEELISVTSSFYKIKSQAQFGRLASSYYARAQRRENPNTGKLEANVYARYRGYL